jgi:hypothetical protein
VVGCELFAGGSELAASVDGHVSKLCPHVCRNCAAV